MMALAGTGQTAGDQQHRRGGPFTMSRVDRKGAGPSVVNVIPQQSTHRRNLIPPALPRRPKEGSTGTGAGSVTPKASGFKARPQRPQKT